MTENPHNVRESGSLLKCLELMEQSEPGENKLNRLELDSRTRRVTETLQILAYLWMGGDLGPSVVHLSESNSLSQSHQVLFFYWPLKIPHISVFCKQFSCLLSISVALKVLPMRQRLVQSGMFSTLRFKEKNSHCHHFKMIWRAALSTTGHFKKALSDKRWTKHSRSINSFFRSLKPNEVGDQIEEDRLKKWMKTKVQLQTLRNSPKCSWGAV